MEPVFQLTALAKHPSLTGHVRLAKRVTGWLPGYAYDEQQFFASDGAAPDVVALPARIYFSSRRATS